MNSEDVEWGRLMYEELPRPLSYGHWKRETEAVIGRLMTPGEAQHIYEIVSGGIRNG